MFRKQRFVNDPYRWGLFLGFDIKKIFDFTKETVHH